MLVKLLIALSLMAVSVAIHAGGLTAALRRLRLIAAAHGFWADTWLFVVVAAWMILLHLVEVSVWGGFYLWRGAIADLPSALYFSAVTYTTTGYGDVVLPKEWRRDGAARAVPRLLMCGGGAGV